jgi:HEAT repeat protein
VATKRDAKTLLDMLRDPDVAVRDKAFLALGNAGRKDRAWVPDLIAGLTDDSHGVRVCAAGALGGIGPPAAEAVPALVALLSDADRNPREVAARALSRIGPAASPAAVPALARMLEQEDNTSGRIAAVVALGTLATRDPAAVAPLIDALDHPEEQVRNEAMSRLSGLRGKGGDALPALRRVVEREGNEPGAPRSGAASAIEAILRGGRPFRLDQPYHAIHEAAEHGCFDDEAVTGEAGRLLDQDEYERALQLLESAIDGEQDPIFWVHMSVGAREIELAVADRYHERYLETSGVGGFWHELERAVRSDRPVDKAMRRMVGYCARVAPDPEWNRFRKLAIDEDLARLERWLRAALTDGPPPDTVTGLWFGIVSMDRGDGPSLDLHVSGGHPDDEEPVDRVIGGGWQPRARYAQSGVLDEICRLAGASAGKALENAEYRLALTYGGLAVRWLVTELPAGLLLGGAPERVVAVGYEDGDAIGVGTLRPHGLAFPGNAR